MDDTRVWATERLKKAVQKIKIEGDRLQNKIPYIAYDGRYTDAKQDRGIDWWTNGFWGGIQWQLYALTGDIVFRDRGIQVERQLEEALYLFRDIHHDVGFLFLPTAIAHYRILEDEQAYFTGLHAASLLAGRFNPAGDYLVAWNAHQPGWMLVDSMMNLPLLFWASKETKDPRFQLIATKHANTALNYLVREDGTVANAASFDPQTGHFIEHLRGQGYSRHSSWSRGMSWALYGFSLSYRHTKEPRYLAGAKKVADRFSAFLETMGPIPPVDFLAPSEPSIVDTSAGLCAACGLLELSLWVSQNERKKYEAIAIHLLQAIEAQYGNWQLQEDGIIQGGTETYHRPATHEVPLIYSDYFFIEALLRITKQAVHIW